MGQRRGGALAAAVALALLAAACSGGAGASGAAPAAPSTTAPVEPGTTTSTAPDPLAGIAVPGDEWETVDPASAGFDPADLDAMAAAADVAGSECLVVTKDGRIVAEWYWRGFDERTEREVFSVTKSITSTLVGIAQDRGLLDLDDRVSSYVEEWVGTPSEDVTVRNLVSNDSGRFQDFATDYVQMAGQAPDKTQFSIDLAQQHEPGSTWVYNNAAIQVLDRVLEEATGVPTAEFAEEALFEPLGMDTSLNRDSAGGTLVFMGAQASCRDLARFGLLFLRGGDWGGEQIVSEAWVEEATSPSTTLNEGYGYLWWLHAGGSDVATDAGAARYGGDVGEGVDDGGTYAALGLFRQLVTVHPADGVVATRLGADRGTGNETFGIGELNTALTASLDG